ncbi:hypothetical protein [Micromonospora sp. WMMD1082]|uniref:hypothetical protein n=1 Tax=Micromonospora sp. WMMD1082 TaxID=3016104 RepID=UPI002415F318|nr:hypothetical protein [Micromonospora sp. WMMD1082]MDG4795685.1 hypothetical protein [Micromonospora sp. WMMD1082]
MSQINPHIHVEQNVVRAGADVRNAMTLLFGATDAPGVVITGCGLEVAYAMTSARPDSVTCLPCLEHACREHRRFADQVERMSRMPGVNINITDDQAAEAAKRHRDLARKFSDRMR